MRTRNLPVAAVVTAVIVLLLPHSSRAADRTELIDARTRPADIGARTYFLGTAATVEDALAFRDELIAAGAWNVNLFLGERVIVCNLPAQAAAAVRVPAVFQAEAASAAQMPGRANGESWGWIADAYGRADAEPTRAVMDGGGAGEPLDDVVLTISPERKREIQRQVESSMAASGDAPAMQTVRSIDQNSEILTSTILVNYIFPESNGFIEASTQDWSAADLREARIGVAGAFLAWQAWTQMDIGVTFNPIEGVSTGYEPIMHDMNSDEVWIKDVMLQLGWGLHGGNSLSIVHEFNEDARATYRTRWVVTCFIANSRGISTHRFGGGNANYTAYAYLGGPYMIEPFPAGGDPNGIGETLVFSKIVQHEFGHNFWTLDEYPGAPGVCGDTSGYLNYSNGNVSMTGLGGEVIRCENLIPCIMHTAAREGQDRPWCRYSLGHLGVIDNNDNGYPDIFEAAPEVVFQPEGPETVFTNQFTLRFQVISTAVPNRNRGQDPDVRVDYAAALGEVKFSLGGTSGISLTPLDGRIDEVVEDFEIPISLASVGQSVVVIRARNSAGYPSAPAAFAKRIYFTGVNYNRIGAAVKENRIEVSWETVGDIFNSTFDVYRLDPGEEMPGTRIAQNVPPENPGTAGFVPYRYLDWKVVPGTAYRYYVVGSFSLPYEGGTQNYAAPSQVVGQIAGIPSVDGEFVSGIAPNPSNGNVQFSIKVPRTYGGNPRAPERIGTQVTAEVFDVHGRRVRLLTDRPSLDDVMTLNWDGRNQQSARLPTGVYFLRVQAGEAEVVRKIVLLR